MSRFIKAGLSIIGAWMIYQGTGCTTVGNAVSTITPVIPGMATAVVVSLTKVNPNAYGGWDGDCPGCDIDGARVAQKCREFGYSSVVTLTNQQATSFRFLAQCSLAALALKPLADKGEKPLLLIYVSGHGGQVPNLTGTEADGQDETLCLWDGQLVDDLLWQALLKVPKGVRVAFITDTCNSGTNYKAPKSYMREFRARASRKAQGEVVCDFLHIGGCADGMSSYGSAQKGGELTYALFEASGGPQGKTWKEWFYSAKEKMPRNQVPVFEILQTTESLMCCKFEEMEALK